MCPFQQPLEGRKHGRERFLTETLDPPDATSDEAGMPLLDEDYLILSTIHSAKGQEWMESMKRQNSLHVLTSNLGQAVSLLENNWQRLPIDYTSALIKITYNSSKKLHV